MATGARSYRWFIAGLTITACQALRRISCRKTSRQPHKPLRETRAVSITLLVLAVIGAIVAWWLSRQRLTAKPWLEVGAIDDFPGTGALSLSAATIGLGVFLAVVGTLFALLISAYFMRMQVADWAQMPAPKLLWFNTGVLILSSVALQYAQVAARRGRMEDVGYGLIAGGLFA
ncbi:MAG: MnhB domain-containing protein, partial [Pseudolabrys sp.]